LDHDSISGAFIALWELPMSDRLNNIFDVFWPSLENILLNIPTNPQGTPEPKRSVQDMVEEILRIVREQPRTNSANLDHEIMDAGFEVRLKLKKHKIEHDNDELENRLKKLMIDFHVPKAEAIRSVTNYYLKEAQCQNQNASER
jgi:hypothetical protein